MICRSSGFYPRAALIAGLALALPLAFAGVVLAQEPAVAQNDTGKLDALKQRERDLEAARDRQRKSAATETALKREIEQLGADRRKLNQDLIDTAGRLRGGGKSRRRRGSNRRRQ
jgi:septal ring factor EnvC (AmiA/AmiB activator)